MRQTKTKKMKPQHFSKDVRKLFMFQKEIKFLKMFAEISLRNSELFRIEIFFTFFGNKSFNFSRKYFIYISAKKTLFVSSYRFRAIMYHKYWGG